MAEIVEILGRGAQRFAERVLCWNRGTIRKGQKERASGSPIVDRFSARGRKRVEEHLPSLLDDIRQIVEPRSQTDPTFRSTRIYTPLTGAEVRKRLVEQYGYRDRELPTIRTIRTKLNGLDFNVRKVRKCKPLKRIPETDAIFEAVHRANHEADADPSKLRISLDTKASVKIGPYSRGGSTRTKTKAVDHDYEAKEILTPFGIFLPQYGESYFWFSTSKVTADFMVDCVEELYPLLKVKYAPSILVVNADNGTECDGRRTQWLARWLSFSRRANIGIELAYYPPYHSKYNPIERCWGVLEQHWGGELLDTIEKTLGLARSMTYRHIHPVVRLVRKAYKTGVSLSKRAMQEIEKAIQRDPQLPLWSIIISPETQSSQMG